MITDNDKIKSISDAIDAISESGQTYFKNKRGMVPSRAETIDIVKKIQSLMFPDYFIVEENYGKSTEERLEELVDEKRTMIFYEAPHKLMATLESMAEVFGPDRPISLCRELTKLHEEVVRTTLGEAIVRYTESAPKGEFVLVLAGAPETQAEQKTPEDAASYVAALMDGGLSRKDAVKQAAKDLNLPKNIVYEAALKLGNE